MDCTSVVGMMVGPKPEKARSAFQIFLDGHTLAIQASLTTLLARTPSAEELTADAQRRFDELPPAQKEALSVSSVQECALRARETLLWEAEATEAGAVVEMCVHTKVALDVHRKRATQHLGRNPAAPPGRTIAQ